MHKASISWFQEYKDIFCCPNCAGDLAFKDGLINCPKCGNIYPSEYNIPLFISPDDKNSLQFNLTGKVKAFYEKNPFPGYDDLDDASALIERARKGLFVKLLDEQVPFGSRVLEAGCGTGQLSNFLGLSNRVIFGTDICLNSLRLAQEFKENNGLENAHFLQMDLFKPVFKQKTFDLVICNGVLHHTADPVKGFKAIGALVKDNGYIIIGLYHKYGRFFTGIGRLIFKISGGRFGFKCAELGNIGKGKQNVWLADQYQNPHESKHTIKEAIGWFKSNGFKFIKSIPATKPFKAFDDKEELFKPESLGSSAGLFFTELKMLFSGHKNGGLFMLIGQKEADNSREWVRCGFCGADEPVFLFEGYDYWRFSSSPFQLVKCAKCGLVYINPRAKDTSDFYVEPKGPPIKDLFSFPGPDRVKIVSKFKKNGKVFDVGFGGGDFLCDMFKQGWDVYGNDVSGSFCAAATNKLGLKNIYKGDILDLDLPGKFFDVVTMWHTLEHMKNPKEVLARINTMLKDDGILIIESPNFSSLQSKFFKDKWHPLNLPCHTYQFTPALRRRLISSSGFAIFRRDYIVNPRISFTALRVSILRMLGIELPPDKDMIAQPEGVRKARRFHVLWVCARFMFNLSCLFLSSILILLNSDDCFRVYCRKSAKGQDR